MDTTKEAGAESATTGDAADRKIPQTGDVIDRKVQGTAVSRPDVRVPPVEGSPDIRGVGEDETRSRHPESIEKLAGGQAITEEDQVNALEWFLSDDEADAEWAQSYKDLQINVGTAKSPKWIPWRIRSLSDPEMRRIEAATQPNRQARRRGQSAVSADATQSNLMMIVEATIDPDLKKAAQIKQIADPTHLLAKRLGHKPGLFVQLSGEILMFSGFDDEDVREPLSEVDAAGN